MIETDLLARGSAVNVAHMVERCHVLGPGARFVLWVQGCPLRCPGCHTPQFQPFREAHWMTIGGLEALILAVEGIEGVTYVGGEPFAQSRALSELSQRLRASGLSVMAYSGFTFEQLRRGALPDSEDLLQQVDLLLDGPYRQDLPTDRPWRGSENQRLIPLTERYRGRASHWDEPTGQQFEVRMEPGGRIEILGVPPRSLVETRGQGHAG